MKAELAAIRALLAPLGYPTPFVDVPSSTTLPYLLLWTSAGSPAVETSVLGERDSIDDTFGVTAAASSPEAVLTVQGRVRGVLVPDGLPLVLDVPGRHAVLDLYDSRPVEVDRDVSPHVAYGVDLYRLRSVPA